MFQAVKYDVIDEHGLSTDKAWAVQNETGVVGIGYIEEKAREVAEWRNLDAIGLSAGPCP